MNPQKTNQVIELENLQLSEEKPLGFNLEAVLREEATQYMDIEWEETINFADGYTRCGTKYNNKVKISCRIASKTTEHFVMDVAVVTSELYSLGHAIRSLSCEEIAGLVLYRLVTNSSPGIVAASVSVKSDTPATITQVWRQGDDLKQYFWYKTFNIYHVSPLVSVKKGCGV